MPGIEKTGSRFYNVENSRKESTEVYMSRRPTKKKRMAILVVVFLAAALLFVWQEREGIRGAILTWDEEVPYQQVSLEERSLEDKYYYGQIPEEDQKAYQEVLEGLREHKEEIYVHCEKAERANELFVLVLKDFPEIFWCDGRVTATAYSGGEPYTVLEPRYLCGAEEQKERQQEIQEEAREWLAGAPADAGDFEKIQYVYETIVDQVEYEAEAPDGQNIYSVLVNRRSVCAGYAKATQYLLERLGVFCTYVTGETREGESHAWNLVLCEGDYYYVDTTWGDPVFQSEEGEEQQGYINYDYLCCSEEELFRTHTPDGDVELPRCTSMDWNYYVVNGMYYTDYDREEILKKMNQVISEGGNPSVFKFSDEKIYEQAREGILGDLIKRAADNLGRWYDLTEVHYRYLDQESQNKITIYWQYE